MQTKISTKIYKYINPAIKVGDRVKMIDGSGLSVVGVNDDVYIVYDYPHITGLRLPLEELVAEVLEIGVDDYAIASSIPSKAYLQDIVIQIGEGKFRTCSSFVSHI